MRNIFVRLVPFIFIGVMIVILAVGVILFSYLLIIGALVGVALFIVAWFKQTFFSSKEMVSREHKKPRKSGRTIDHE